MQILKAVNFGSRLGGLATVGYTLYNSDGTENQARSTANITEIVVGSGMYQCFITFDDTFQGSIVWDTGEAEPKYAVETVDYQFIASQGGGGGIGYIDSVWNNADKETLLDNVKACLNLLLLMKKLFIQIANIEDRLINLNEKINGLDFLALTKELSSLILEARREYQEGRNKDNKSLLKVAEALSVLNKGLTSADQFHFIREDMGKIRDEISFLSQATLKGLSLDVIEEMLKKEGVHVS